MQNEVREKIFAAADTLVANGKKPTLAAVLNAIGRGSSTTVNKYMQEWRAERQPSAPVAPENAAPPVVAATAARMANEIWLAAVELANEGLAADRAELEAERAEIHGQLQETAEYADAKAEQVEMLAANVEDLSAKLEKESHEHASTYQLLQSAARDNARLEAQHNSTMDRYQELKLECAGLVEANKRTDAAREKAIQLATEADKALAEQRARYELMKEKAEAAEADRRAAEQRAVTAELKAAELTGKLEALTDRLDQQAKLLAQLTPAAAEKPTKKKAEGPAKEGTE